MMATKEQEMAALKKIRKIVDDLGENSYLSMAFEGCFEIAEENIENDFGCSLKQQADKAKEDAEYFKRAAEVFSADQEKLYNEIEMYKRTSLSRKDLMSLANLVSIAKSHHSDEMDLSAADIVKFADEPESKEFKKAVQDHRVAKAQFEQCEALIKRLLAAAKAYDDFGKSEKQNNEKEFV